MRQVINTTDVNFRTDIRGSETEYTKNKTEYQSNFLVPSQGNRSKGMIRYVCFGSARTFLHLRAYKACLR